MASGTDPIVIWVKICGITTREAVDAAVDAGADAIGFVFAASKRQISTQRAVQLTQGVRIARVAVMRHPAQALLDEVWSVFHPDVLQTDAGDLGGLRLPEGLSVLPVIRSDRERPDVLPRRVLFEGPLSGAGATCDWAAAARLAAATQVVLAGGLNPTNVGAAIAGIRPFGVDVSSGVEVQPGVKDPMKIYEFVRNARAAATGAGR